MPRPDLLLGKLRDLGVTLPQELAKRMRRFAWTIDLCYQSGRLPRSQTKGLSETANAIKDWPWSQVP